ncbi:hypothetical protein P4S64_15295 [Vibrio sp. M60_M31a]
MVFHAVDTSEKQILVRSLEEVREQVCQTRPTFARWFITYRRRCDYFRRIQHQQGCLGINPPHDLLGEKLSRLFIDENTKKVFGHPLSTLISDKPFICLTSARCGFERKVQPHADSTAILGSASQIILIQDADNAPKNLSGVFG